MECVHKRSGIGGELVAFPCIKPMAVGFRCFRHPTNRLHTRLTKHANHAEGVQYAITSFVNGMDRSSRNASTCSARRSNSSSKFLLEVCFRLHRRLSVSSCAGGG